MGVKPAAASASVMLVPEPPKSKKATTPLAGRRSLEFNAVNAVTESETSRGETPPLTKPACVHNASCSPRRACGSQCAGTAIVMLDVDASPPLALINASRASTSNSAGSWVDPSADVIALDPPTRSTKPVINVPVSTASVSPMGTPSSGARSGKRVNTARRETGGFPLRTATKLVVPIDNPNGSYIKRIPSSIAVGGQG